MPRYIGEDDPHAGDTMFADLHVHTTNSDGELSTDLERVSEVAAEKGLNAIAITDHDVFHDGFDSPLEVRNGVDLIHGMELRVESPEYEKRFDLLAYGITPTKRLESLVTQIQDGREKRAEKMLALIEDETGVRLNFTPTKNTGRPHIAKAIAENESIDETYESAFENLIGRDCAGYAPRPIPSFDHGIDVLAQASELISLAHPYRYTNPRDFIPITQHEQIDGIEMVYPYDDRDVEYKETNLDSVAVDWFDLTITGGSDAHTPESIATAGLIEDHYYDFLEDSGLDIYSGHTY